MVCDTPPSQDACTNQIWNSYLKEYRRYAPDTKRDGRTDGRTVRLLYASHSSFGGIKSLIYLILIKHTMLTTLLFSVMSAEDKCLAQGHTTVPPVVRLLIFFKLNIFEKFFHHSFYHQKFKQFGSRSGPTFSRA